jgi:hypothetical protein
MPSGERASPEERWLRQPPDAMAALSLRLAHERFALILDDLRRLPSSRPLVAEGTPLLPALVAPQLDSPDRAVWLLPSDEFERARLAERAGAAFVGLADPERARLNRIERERAVCRALERETAERGLRTLIVDGSRDVGAVAAVVERRFAPALESVAPLDPPDRPRLRRFENAAVFHNLAALLGPSAEAEYAFSCECERLGCTERVDATMVAFAAVLAAGEGRQLVAPGHGSSPAGATTTRS